jgi:hypothetical protein
MLKDLPVTLRFGFCDEKVHVGWKSEALVSMHIEGKFGL